MTNESNAIDATKLESESNASAVKPDAETPDYLVPSMGKVAVGEPAYYRSLFILDTIGSRSAELKDLTGPIDPYDEKLPEANLKPAYGVLTVHEQVWCQKGIELGNLLQSLCLAPGEVTQVAVTRWERSTKGSSSDSVEQGESVSSYAEQNRAVNEVQRAVAKEAQSGSSSAFASSASAQAGVSFLFGSASASSTTSTALTAQFSAGSRDLAAESTNAIAQSTAEKSQALRSRRQSVVREVSEQEAESQTTRVLANYNRRHTLNILFFEVLQTYKVKTELTGWDRCLFVPLVPLDFENPSVIKYHQAQLLGIFADLGATEMIERLKKALDERQEETATAEQTQFDSQIKDYQRAKQLAQEYAQARVPTPRTILVVDEENPCSLNNGPSNSIEKTVYESNTQKMTDTSSEYSVLKDKYALLPPIADASLNSIDSAIKDLEVKRAAASLPIGKIFNKQRLFLSQQLWLRMSPYRIYRILQEYKIQEQPISTLVDPQPVGVFGNYLAFRWGFENSQEGEAEREKFEKKYLNLKPKGGTESESPTVGLPTSGVFAEAVLGQGLAAEQIDERFGKWGDNMIPILPPKIAELTSRDRAKAMDLKGQDFASNLAQLRAEKLADVSHIDKALGQVGKGDMFRDMGGLAQAVSLADKLAALSAEGATKAGDRAVQLQSKVLDTFSKVLDSKVGQAAVAEFMLPGSGAALLGAQDNQSKSDTNPKKPPLTEKKP
jgi:hypothetical protein